MELTPQHQAQQRVDRIAAFRAELTELEREQALTLTPDQRAHLEAHLAQVLSTLREQFGADVTDAARRISWGMRVASLLGGLALFAALILFLHRIWGALPFAVQFGVLTLVPLLFLAALEFAHRRGVSGYVQALLGLAAGTAFVLELDALGKKDEAEKYWRRAIVTVDADVTAATLAGFELAKRHGTSRPDGDVLDEDDLWPAPQSASGTK